MPINPEKVEIGTLVRLEEGSYFCSKAQRYIFISSCKFGVVIEKYEYATGSYPMEVLGYKFLAEVIIGPHYLLDIPNFKLYGVQSEEGP
tara:strand:- start:401 stop:667 length:267 start_codon:yes stop_codon:yes gene_type:complete